MDVLVIGCGSIGISLAQAMERIPEIESVYITDKSHTCSTRISGKLTKTVYEISVEEVLEKVDFVIEAASQEAVAEHGPKVLSNGKDLMILSVGALVNEKLYAKLESIAKRNDARILIPSGAICGIDGLLAAKNANVDKVKLTTYKPPANIYAGQYLTQQGIDLDSIKEPTVIFQGRAKDAVQHFPRNINIAATLSLAGIGFERTQVVIVADPTLKKNRHKLEVEGDFGRIKVEIESIPSPLNPMTSYMAVLSAISVIKQQSATIWEWI